MVVILLHIRYLLFYLFLYISYIFIIIDYGEGYCCYATGRSVWHILCTGTLFWKLQYFFWGSLKTFKETCFKIKKKKTTQNPNIRIPILHWVNVFHFLKRMPVVIPFTQILLVYCTLNSSVFVVVTALSCDSLLWAYHLGKGGVCSLSTSITVAGELWD